MLSSEKAELAEVWIVFIFIATLEFCIGGLAFAELAFAETVCNAVVVFLTGEAIVTDAAPLFVEVVESIFWPICVS